MMGDPFTLQIFYPDGDPENMRVADKRNWTGTVFYISRTHWNSGIRQYREQLESPGVYVLAGTKENIEESEDLQSIYIGHAENLIIRVNQHMEDPEKQFWESVVCVVGGKSFNNAHFRWMESDLIQQAMDNDRCFLKNRMTPNKVQMGISDMVEIEKFIKETLQIFPVVEIDAFVAPKTLPKSNKNLKLKPAKDQTHEEFDQDAKVELKQKILDAFQSKEKVKLLKRNRSTFYDESKVVHVCCGVSKSFHSKNQGRYWYGISMSWLNFMEGGAKSYLLLGMEGQTKAIMLSFDQFKDMKHRFTPTEKNGAITKWNVIVIKNGANFFFQLPGGEKIDASPFLFDIE